MVSLHILDVNPYLSLYVRMYVCIYLYIHTQVYAYICQWFNRSECVISIFTWHRAYTMKRINSAFFLGLILLTLLVLPSVWGFFEKIFLKSLVYFMRVIYLKVDNIIHTAAYLCTIKCNIFDQSEMNNRVMANCPALHVVEFLFFLQDALLTYCIWHVTVWYSNLLRLPVSIQMKY